MRCELCGTWRNRLFGQARPMPCPCIEWAVHQDHAMALDGSGYEDTGATVWARDAETAAEKWAEDDDCSSADYLIVGGDPARVKLVNVATGEAFEFRVTGEAVPTYSAQALA